MHRKGHVLIGEDSEAVAAAGKSGMVVPPASSHHSGTAVVLGLLATVLCRIRVDRIFRGAPFPDLSRHSLATVGREPFASTFFPVVTPRIESPIRPTGRLFPLGLTGKSKANPMGIGHGSLPGHAQDRLVGPFLVGVQPQRALHKGLPAEVSFTQKTSKLTLTDRSTTDPKLGQV
jgi:hypothetical protein